MWGTLRTAPPGSCSGRGAAPQAGDPTLPACSHLTEVSPSPEHFPDCKKGRRQKVASLSWKKEGPLALLGRGLPRGALRVFQTLFLQQTLRGRGSPKETPTLQVRNSRVEQAHIWLATGNMSPRCVLTASQLHGELTAPRNFGLQGLFQALTKSGCFSHYFLSLTTGNVKRLFRGGLEGGEAALEPPGAKRTQRQH